MCHEPVDENGRTRLMAAAEAGRQDDVRRLLDAGASLDSQDRDGDTALTLAIRGGHERIALLLIDAGADADLANLDCETPLLLASGRAGSLQVAGRLLERGARVGSRNGLGETPLHQAAYFGHPDIVRLLVAAGADVNARDRQGETPLHKTAAYDWCEIAGILAAAGADRNAVNSLGETGAGKASLRRPCAFPEAGCTDARQSATEYREFIRQMNALAPDRLDAGDPAARRTGTGR